MFQVYDPPMHTGVIYGYRTVGDYGDDAAIYYFGRSRLAKMYDMSLEGPADTVIARQKKMLKDTCRRIGLNACSRVLLWGRTSNLNKDWDDLKDFLKGNRFAPLSVAHPLITNQLWVGDNWFSCESHGPEEFGIFVRAVWNRLHANRADEQVLVGDDDDDDDDEEEQPPE